MGGDSLMQQSVPRYRELIWPTVKALRELGGSGHITEISDAVVVIEGLTEEQQAQPHAGSSQSELDYRLGWVRTMLRHSGVVANSSRGVWSLTEKGAGFAEQQVDDVYNAYQAYLTALRKKRDSPENRGEAQPGIESEDSDAAEPADSVGGWKDELLVRLKGMAPDAFERLAQRLLREAGFRNVKVLGRSGDGGIDGVGVYRVSLVSFPTYFQCKRYQGVVPPKEVRDFRGALAGRGDKGLLITTGTFTSSAKEEANRDGAPPVDLVDGEELCDLLKKYELGVTTRTIEESTVVADFFDQI